MALPYATENQLKLLEQKTKSELDKKTANVNLTADTLEDMNALITKGSVNDGQLCYCKEDQQIYVFKNNAFRRMIDEGALNAQIQEATTTKQDKLTFKTYRVSMTRPATDLGGAAANLAAGKGTTATWGVAYAPTSNVELQNELNNAKQITLQVAPQMIKIGNGYCLAIPVDSDAAYINEIDGNKRISGWFTLYPILVDPNINASTRFTPSIPLTINIIY